MIETGYITSVNVNVAGSGLQGDHAIGATTLFLEDASDFNEEGGVVALGALQYVYTATDFDLDTLTLAAPLTVAALDGDSAQVAPMVLEKTAAVLLENSGESITARVPHTMVDLIPEGVRDDTATEAVEVELVNYDWVIVDVMGKQPSIDGAYLATNSVTLNAMDPAVSVGVQAAVPDGLAPSSSPTPILAASLGHINVRWIPITNHDPVTYDVHISTLTGFVPDSTTLYVSTSGASTTIRNLPDGSLLASPTVYYVKIVARDADGSGPSSPEASGTVAQATGADISSNYAYLGQIDADQIQAGSLSADVAVVGSVVAYGTNGEQVGLSGDGFFSKGLDTDGNLATYVDFPTDGAKPNIISGTLQATTLSVVGDPITGQAATFRNNSAIEANSTLSLASTTAAPSAKASLSSFYSTSNLTMPTGTVIKWTWNDLIDGGMSSDSTGKMYGMFANDFNQYTMNVVWNSTGTVSSWVENHFAQDMWFYDYVTALNGATKVGATVRANYTSSVMSIVINTAGQVPNAGTATNINTIVGGINSDGFVRLGYNYTNNRLVLSWKTTQVSNLKVQEFTINADNTVTAFGGVMTGPNTTADYTPVHRGTFDFGADRLVYGDVPTVSGQQWFYQTAVPATTWTPVANESWPAGPTVFSTLSFWWDVASGKFKAMVYGTKTVQTYEGLDSAWTTASSTWNFKYSWFSSTGPAETLPGPVASIVMPKRSRVAVTIPVAPGAASGAYVYRAVGSGTYAKVGTITAPAIVWNATYPLTLGTAPLTTPTFPAGVDAIITNTAGSLIIKADSSITAQTLTINDRANLPAKTWQTGTVVITPSAANTQTSTTLTFPTAFANTPIVMLQVITGLASAGSNNAWPSSPSATSVIVNLLRANTTTTTIRWFAIDV